MGPIGKRGRMPDPLELAAEIHSRYRKVLGEVSREIERVELGLNRHELCGETNQDQMNAPFL